MKAVPILFAATLLISGCVSPQSQNALAVYQANCAAGDPNSCAAAAYQAQANQNEANTNAAVGIGAAVLGGAIVGGAIASEPHYDRGYYGRGYDRGYYRGRRW